MRQQCRVVVWYFFFLFATAAHHAHALDIPWDGSGTPPFGTNSESWQNVDNWMPVGGIVQVHRVPGDLDVANLSSPTNDSIRLFADTEPINGLNLSNSVNLFTNGHLLHVDNASLFQSATTAIAGVGTQLNVENQLGSQNSFSTDRLIMGDSARIVVQDSLAEVEEVATLTGDSRIFIDGYSFFYFFNELNLIDSGIEAFGASSRLSFFSIDFNMESSFLISRNHELRFELNDTLEAHGSNVSAYGILISGGSTVRLLDDDDGDRSSFDALGQDVVIEDGGTLELHTNGLVTSELMVNFRDVRVSDGGRILGNSTLLLTDNYLTVDSGAQVTASQIDVGESNPDRAAFMSVTGEGTTLSLDLLTVGSDDEDIIFTESATAYFSDQAVATIHDLAIGVSDRFGEVNIASGSRMDVTGVIQVGNPFGASGISQGASIVLQRSSLHHDGVDSTRVGGNGLEATGLIRVRNGATYTSSTGEFLVEDSGRISVSGSDDEAAEMTINGPLVVQGRIDVAFSQSNPTNRSVLEINAATSIDGGKLTFHNGLLTAQSMVFSNGGTFDFVGGKFSATSFNADLLNDNGIVAPGTTAAGDGAGSMAIVGDYTATSGATLAIDIGGTTIISEYDFFDVANNFSVGGDLEVSLFNGFLPDMTDSFIIANADSLLGLFDNVLPGARLDTADGGGSFVVNYGVTSPFDPDQIVLSDFLMTTDADIDNDGDVDGTDFLLIQRNNPSLIQLWQSQYGASSLAAGVAVPEPSCVFLTMAAATLISLNRKELR